MHNIFNINLTKFGQLDIKGGKLLDMKEGKVFFFFFFFFPILGGVSFFQTLREKSVITHFFFCKLLSTYNSLFLFFLLF